MSAEQPDRQDGSQPERGTGQRQDHRAVPPGHEVPNEGSNLDDPEDADPAATPSPESEATDSREG
ncbi:MAG: hypothetical protein ACJ75Z_09375 [Solirubrobacterales bacterium]